MNLEKKIFNACIWFFAVCVLVILLTSCSPYAGLQIATPTAQPTATKAESQDATLEPTPRPITCTVNAGRVYLRKGAGMSHAAIDVLHSGDVLRILNAAEWLKVETPQHTKGWVYSKYCK